MMMITQNVRIHAALATANVMFGLGSIVGALGLAPATNPLAFTFVREVIAGVLLLTLSFWVGRSRSSSSQQVVVVVVNDHHQNTEKEAGDCNCSSLYHHDYLVLPLRRHFPKFCLLGLLLFINQGAYIVGIQLAGPVTGSVWQPTSPILTAGISMLCWKKWGMHGERWNVTRFTGVLVAFAGCASMVLLSDYRQENNDKKAQHSGGSLTAFWIGNVCFFSNCLAMSFYVLQSKQLLSIYPSLTVIGWSYMIASLCMFLAAFLSSVWGSMEHLICPTCNTKQGTTTFLHIPRETIPALAYYIIAMSVGSWGLIVWSNQYATGTLVVGYNVIQPVVSLFFTIMILLFRWVAECSDDDDDDEANNSAVSSSLPCLNEPGIETLCGMLGVACGLYLVIQTEPSTCIATGIPLEQLDDAVDKDHRDDTSTLLAEYGTMPCIVSK